MRNSDPRVRIVFVYRLRGLSCSQFTAKMVLKLGVSHIFNFSRNSWSGKSKCWRIRCHGDTKSENRKRDQGAHHGNGSQGEGDQDLTEENVSDKHAKSVLIGFLDPMTKQQQPIARVIRLRPWSSRMLLAHQRQTDDIKSEPMQLGKVEGSFFDASTDDTAWEQENVWMMKGGKSCHTCGGKGHFARECQSKGKGKVQEGGWGMGGSKGRYIGKGGSKGGKNQKSFTKGGQKGGKYGKGGGKGPAGGCWTCGGPHFASDRPWTKSRTYQLGEWFPQETGVHTH